jgi:hypothetical protein
METKYYITATIAGKTTELGFCREKFLGMELAKKAFSKIEKIDKIIVSDGSKEIFSINRHARF